MALGVHVREGASDRRIDVDLALIVHGEIVGVGRIVISDVVAIAALRFLHGDAIIALLQLERAVLAEVKSLSLAGFQRNGTGCLADLRIVRFSGDCAAVVGNIIVDARVNNDISLLLFDGGGRREALLGAAAIHALEFLVDLDGVRIVQVEGVRGGFGDLQRALSLGDGVVGGLGALVQRVGERVLRLADVGNRAGHVVGRALAVNEAVAANGDLRLGQGCAVVNLAGAGGGQGDAALVDGQGAGIGGGDVIQVIVRADGIVAKRDVVGIGVSAAAAGADTFKGHALGSAGVAGDRVLLTVVRHGVAVRGQRDVLVVVEVEHILTGADRHRRLLAGNEGVTVNRCVGNSYLITMHCIIASRGGLNLFTIPEVVDGIRRSVCRLAPRAGQCNVPRNRNRFTIDIFVTILPTVEGVGVVARVNGTLFGLLHVCLLAGNIMLRILRRIYAVRCSVIKRIRHLIGINVCLWGLSVSNGIRFAVGECDRRVVLVGFILVGRTPSRGRVGLHLDLNDQLFRVVAGRVMRREIIVRDRYGLAVGAKLRVGSVRALLLVAVRIDRVDLHVVHSTGSKREVVGQLVGDHGVRVQSVIARRGNHIGERLENSIQSGSVSCRHIVVRRSPLKILGDLPTMIADVQKGAFVCFQSNSCSILKIA